MAHSAIYRIAPFSVLPGGATLFCSLSGPEIAPSNKNVGVLNNARTSSARNVSSWLKADLQSPEIDFRSTPNNGHSSPGLAPEAPEAKIFWKFAKLIRAHGRFVRLFLRRIARQATATGAAPRGYNHERLGWLRRLQNLQAGMAQISLILYGSREWL